jgi:hypothetical protein
MHPVWALWRRFATCAEEHLLKQSDADDEEYFFILLGDVEVGLFVVEYGADEIGHFSSERLTLFRIKKCPLGIFVFILPSY